MSSFIFTVPVTIEVIPHDEYLSKTDIKEQCIQSAVTHIRNGLEDLLYQDNIDVEGFPRVVDFMINFPEHEEIDLGEDSDS